MIDFEEVMAGIIGLAFLGLIAGGCFAIAYHFDKAKCYDMADNYEATVNEYSFLKDYCFVSMPSGDTVNLDNYRDTNLTD